MRFPLCAPLCAPLSAAAAAAGAPLCAAGAGRAAWGLASLLVVAGAALGHADTIYVEKGVFPPLEPVDGWSAEGGKVEREVLRADGSTEKVTLFGIRGRVVAMSAADDDVAYHYQVLLRRNPDVADKPRYRYHPSVALIPRRMITDYEKDFDSWLDLRLLLGNDDLRLGEAVMGDPSIMAHVLGSSDLRKLVKLVEGGDDWVYSLVGYGGLEGPRLMTFRLGFRPGNWDALGRPGSGTPYQPGWLSYLVRMGAPRTDLERAQAVIKARARGELVPAVGLIPLRAPGRIPFVEGPPGAVAAPSEPEVLGADLRPTLHGMLLAAARENRFKGVLTRGQGDQSRGAVFQEVVVKVMRELCTWSKVAGTGEIQQRARAVGREARAVVLEALEAAMAGRNSSFDVMLAEIPAGTRRGPDDRLESAEYLPVDPSWVAMVAMRVVQSCPEWRDPDSPAEAERLVRALVRLSRPPALMGPDWPRDPRSVDFGRALVRGSTETSLSQVARLTLAGAAREGILLPGRAPDGSPIPSPYLPHLAQLLNDLEPGDRGTLLQAMTEAGVGDASLYEQVIDRLFAIGLDSGWESGVSPEWAASARRDAVATLGFLVRLDASGKSLSEGVTASQIVFRRLDPIFDAVIAERATENEKAFVALIQQLNQERGLEDPRAAWLPEVARGRELVGDLTQGYTQYVQGAPVRVVREGGRRVESMVLAEDRAAEAERLRVAVEAAKRRANEVGRMFPQRR